MKHCGTPRIKLLLFGNTTKEQVGSLQVADAIINARACGVTSGQSKTSEMYHGFENCL